MVGRVIGSSRLLVLLAVAGSFVSAAVLLLHGLVRSVALVAELVAAPTGDRAASKELVIGAIEVVDIFLVGTVLYIVGVGLYELFVGELPLPQWLQIHSLDDLKSRLTGVVVVGLLVAFFGVVVEWKGGIDVLGLGLAIAAVSLAAGFVFRHPRDAAGG